ncbi:MAG: transcriptional coactivator p15/PC4 family protein [bacterium]|nr:transcriptional coactivator p15/PC4 family protein [bacterium]
MAELKEVCRLQKNATTEFVFSLTDYRGENYVDIREWVETGTYKGFTKKGLRFRAELVQEFREKIQELENKLKG